MKSKPKKKKASAKRGPKPEMSKIEGDWQDAIKRSFQKQRPTNGWPKE